jgi:hypothetical protein
MRNLVVVALVLTALLSLTSTWALQSSTVGTGLQANVVTSDLALFSLTPGPTTIGSGNRAATASLVNGALVLDFRKSANSATGFRMTPTGLLDPSVRNKYSYKGLFSVTNNSKSSHCISVYVQSQPGPAELSAIWLGGAKVAGSKGARLGCIDIAAGGTAWVDFDWIIGSTPTTAAQFTVLVEKRIAP